MLRIHAVWHVNDGFSCDRLCHAWKICKIAKGVILQKKSSVRAKNYLLSEDIDIKIRVFQTLATNGRARLYSRRRQM